MPRHCRLCHVRWLGSPSNREMRGKKGMNGEVLLMRHKKCRGSTYHGAPTEHDAVRISAVRQELRKAAFGVTNYGFPNRL